MSLQIQECCHVRNVSQRERPSGATVSLLFTLT